MTFIRAMFLLAVGFALYFSGFNLATGALQVLFIIPTPQGGGIISYAWMAFMLQVAGGLLLLTGLLMAFRSITVNAQTKVIQLQRQLKENMENSFSSMKTEVVEVLTPLIRRIDNSYKLLDERLGIMEEALRSSGLNLPRMEHENGCKFCGGKVPLSSPFCSQCGKAQY